MAKRDEHLEAMVNHVVELIETHGVEWSKGWRDISCRPSNVDTGTVYRGWNSFWLAMNGATHVATFKGWQRLGYSCKGLKGKGIFITTRKLIKKENDAALDIDRYKFYSLNKPQGNFNNVMNAPTHMSYCETYFNRDDN